MGECKDCGKGDPPGKGDPASIKKRIAKRAAVALAGLPEVGSDNGDEKKAALISGLRSLFAELSLAGTWDLEDAKSYERTLDFVEVALEYAVAGSGRVAEQTAANCGAAKRTCNTQCHEEDGSYWCFVDCRIEYGVCLASVITGSKQ